MLAIAIAVLSLTSVAWAYENDDQLLTATVYQSGQSATQDSVSIGMLQTESQQCPEYTGPESGFQGPDGPGGLPKTTWSLATVLGCLSAPISPADVKSIVVHQSSGAPEAGPDSVLSGSADLTAPSDFADSDEVPVISNDGSGVIYNRPSRGSGDDTATDVVDETDPSPFAFDVFEGPALTVTATASQTTVQAGATIDFSATATGPDDGDVAYSWNFDGGAASSNQQSPQVVFETAGTYKATVEATDPAGGGGAARPIAITVDPASGQPPTSTGSNPHNGNGSNSGATSPTGPVNGSGNRSPGTGRQPTGGATGPVGGHGHTTNGSGGSHDHGHSGTHGNRGGRQRGNGSGSGSGTTGSGTGSGSQGNDTGSSSGSGDASSSHAASRSGSTHHQRQRSSPLRSPPASARTPAQPPLVTGRLVSDVMPLPPGASSLVHSEPAPAGHVAPVRRGVRASVVPILAGTLTVVLLLALGASRELGGRRRWRALGLGAS